MIKTKEKATQVVSNKLTSKGVQVAATTSDVAITVDERVYTKPFVEDAGCQTMDKSNSKVKTTGSQTKGCVGFIATKTKPRVSIVGSTRKCEKVEMHRAVV